MARPSIQARATNWDRRWRASLLSVMLVLLSVSVPSGLARAADDDEPDSNGFASRMGEGLGNAIGSMKKTMGFNKPPGPPPTESPSGCPQIVVLDGTGAQRVMANAAAGNLGLKYQYSINDVARECHLSNNQMVIKVGVEGRVLLGPAGAPGAFDVPIRIAVVDQLDQKPAVSKLYKVAASIPSGQNATPYTLVADSIVIPFGTGRNAADYSIKVGIDSVKGAEAPASTVHRKRKPVAPASTASQ